MTYEAPRNLSIAQLSRILQAIPELKAWITAVEEYALFVAQSGTEVPGFKVGTTRSQRIWADQPHVIEILENMGLDRDEYLPRILLSVAQMEKLLGKHDFANLLHEVGSTIGNPKLIPS